MTQCYSLRVKIGGNEFSYEGPGDPTHSTAYYDFRAAVASAERLSVLESLYRGIRAELDILKSLAVQSTATQPGVPTPDACEPAIKPERPHEGLPGLRGTDNKTLPDSKEEGKGGN